MFFRLCLFLFVFLQCVHARSSVHLGERLIEYQLPAGRQVVVVVVDGISVREASQLAQTRAAELTVEQGGRYFTIDSMYLTEVMRSDRRSEDQKFYGNMYQELIIEGDFGRSRANRWQDPVTRTYPAIRLEFTPYKELPNRKAIDACTLTECE